MSGRRLRVAVVETAGHGGLLHYATQLADALAERGHDVDLIVPRGNELHGRAGAARRRAVLIAPSEPPSGRLPSSRAASFARRGGVAVRLMSSWARVVVEARRGRYDLVLLDADLTLAPVTLTAVGLARLPRPPRLGCVCHNVRTYNRWGGDDLTLDADSLAVRLLRQLYASLDVVLVHGERSRKVYEETWPMPAGVLAEIPHGDERVFGDPPPPADEPRILFFGDWRKPKGLDVLMPAFDRLAERRPEVRLTIAGTPSPEDFDPQLVRDWAARHPGRVEVDERYVPMDEVPGFFARARVVVCPYHVAAQSGVVHLAMTMGRAVVASDVGDLQDSVRDGETGLLVAPGDPEALSRALEALACDAGRAREMGAAGEAWVRQGVSWEVVAERVEAAIEAVVP